MYKDHQIGVVVPVYNEADFIGDVLDSIPSFVDRAYAVDDCSTDGTWERIERRASVTIDILVCLNANDARIVDAPMPAVYGEEESGIEYHTFVTQLSLLRAAGFMWRLRSTDTGSWDGQVALLYGLAGIVGAGTAGLLIGTLLIGRPAVNSLGVLAMFALCPTFFIVAILLERQSNRDLYMDHNRLVDDRV